MNTIKVNCARNDGVCAQDVMEETMDFVLTAIDRELPDSINSGIRFLMFDGDANEDLADLAYSASWGTGRRCLTFSVLGTNWSTSTSSTSCIEPFENDEGA